MHVCHCPSGSSGSTSLAFEQAHSVPSPRLTAPYDPQHLHMAFTGSGACPDCAQTARLLKLLFVSLPASTCISAILVCGQSAMLAERGHFAQVLAIWAKTRDRLRIDV